MLTSRERVRKVLNHEVPDRVPTDLGSTAVTGMAVSTVSTLRRRLGLDGEGDRVKVGEIAGDLRQRLGVDVVGIEGRKNLFGFENRGWKPWELFDGTPVLVPEKFNTEAETDGSVLMYPEGDRSVPSSGRMPKDGYYFDSIIRQPPIEEDRLRVQDNLEEFAPVSDEELEHFRQQSESLYRNTDLAIVASFGGTSFGDIALVPAPWLKYPKGIRDVEEWYVSLIARKGYIYEVFERQCEIALGNLPLLHEAVGDRVDIIFVSGTDFGMQSGPFLSQTLYRELFKPFHRRVNGWVHDHTTWKTFIHTCGGVEPLLVDLVEAGFDILNPVQCSAAGMDPRVLKQRYGDQLVFWGGGVDTQRTLPFGTPEDVRREVKERLEILGQGGGFVFNPIHNVQANTPVENLLAMFEAVQEYGAYG
jgi:hypothetical protein